MKTLIQAIVTLCALALALPSKAADSLVLSQVDALCVANRAAPDRVFAAAEVAGWKPIQDEYGGILDLFGMTASPAIRLKNFDERQLMLKAKEEVLSVPDGSVRRRICSVSEDARPSPDAAESLRARFGVPPTAIEGPISSWAWVETANGKQFISGQGREDFFRALADHGVYLLAVASEGQISIVMFYELSRVSP